MYGRPKGSYSTIKEVSSRSLLLPLRKEGEVEEDLDINRLFETALGTVKI